MKYIVTFEYGDTEEIALLLIEWNKKAKWASFRVGEKTTLNLYSVVDIQEVKDNDPA